MVSAQDLEQLADELAGVAANLVTRADAFGASVATASVALNGLRNSWAGPRADHVVTTASGLIEATAPGASHMHAIAGAVGRLGSEADRIAAELRSLTKQRSWASASPEPNLVRSLDNRIWAMQSEWQHAMASFARTVEAPIASLEGARAYEFALAPNPADDRAGATMAAGHLGVVDPVTQIRPWVAALGDVQPTSGIRIAASDNDLGKMGSFATAVLRSGRARHMSVAGTGSERPRHGVLDLRRRGDDGAEPADNTTIGLFPDDPSCTAVQAGSFVPSPLDPSVGGAASTAWSAAGTASSLLNPIKLLSPLSWALTLADVAVCRAEWGSGAPISTERVVNESGEMVFESSRSNHKYMDASGLPLSPDPATRDRHVWQAEHPNEPYPGYPAYEVDTPSTDR